MRTSIILRLLLGASLLSLATSVRAEEVNVSPAVTPVSDQSAAQESPSGGSHTTDPIPVPVPDTAKHSAGCIYSITLGVQDNYPRQDLGNFASTKPVMQDLALASCGHLSVDWWSSTQLTGGRYGNRGAGDEHDGELTYDNTLFKKVTYELYVGYYALNLDKGLGSTADDLVEGYGEVREPFTFKFGTVAPFVRYTHLFPMSDFLPNFDFVRFGARFDSSPFQAPLLGVVSIHAEGSPSWNLNPAGRVQHPQVTRGELDLNKALGSGWSFSVGTKLTTFDGVTPLLKFTRTFH